MTDFCCSRNLPQNAVSRSLHNRSCLVSSCLAHLDHWLCHVIHCATFHAAIFSNWIRSIIGAKYEFRTTTCFFTGLFRIASRLLRCCTRWCSSNLLRDVSCSYPALFFLPGSGGMRGFCHSKYRVALQYPL